MTVCCWLRRATEKSRCPFGTENAGRTTSCLSTLFDHPAIKHSWHTYTWATPVPYQSLLWQAVLFDVLWSGTYPVSLLILFFLLLFLSGRPLPTEPKAPSFQIRSGWNLAGMFLEWIRIDRRSPEVEFPIWRHTFRMTAFREKPLARRVWRHWFAVCATVPNYYY